MYRYLSQTNYARWTVPTHGPELATASIPVQRCSSFVNAHKHAFFVRNVPAWNALFPASVCADSVAAFHSSICNNFMYWRFFFIWLVILFVFTYSFVFILFIYFAVNVMSFRVLTVHCQISSLEAIMSIKEKEKKNGLQIMVWLINFRFVQIWLVMSMQFIFGDDLNDAPYWSRFASLAIFMFLNKLTQSIRKQIENENYFKRDISRHFSNSKSSKAREFKFPWIEVLRFSE